MVGMMRFAGALSKDARKAMEPIQSTVSVKGNRMAHKTADSVSITDIDKETITHVNYASKTYSVITFAQMKQALEDMTKKMQSRKPGEAPDFHFDVKLNDTGQTRTIAGNSAHEIVMTMTMQGADAKSGAKGGIDMTNDMWIAPKVSGYEEMRAFYGRMGEKLAWMPGSNPMMNRPDVARAMAEMYKEGAKMDGMPVLTLIKMGGNMEGMPSSTEGNSSASPPSVSDALSSALSGRLGLGGFGRKKKPDAQSADTGTTTAAGSLMEMTVEVTSYSADAADSSLFEVPSGFSKVEEDPMHPARSR